MAVFSPRNYIMNLYFRRLPRLWNSLPTIDLSLPIDVIKNKVRNILWHHFVLNFDSDNYALYGVAYSMYTFTNQFSVHVFTNSDSATAEW